MGKNIVFCADGTWNGPNTDHDNDGIPDTTNVLKAFLLLSGEPDPASTLLASEQEIAEPGPDGQVAKYLHGVGDSRTRRDQRHILVRESTRSVAVTYPQIR